ncbi:MAG: TraB/GumN family protein [Myxococcales bacterium]|nr:TraB/GumN family protein [Myxococcales bacterium]MCB9524887.1 TraB/GumN family protein [Myxococcales bacterium]
MDLGPNVTVLERDGRTFYLVGTAHISQRSVEDVRRTIELVKPDTVCIELDATRFEAMMDPDRWRKLDVFQVIKQKKVLFVLAQLALSGYQRRLGDALGVKPGAEMLEAVEAAKDVGAEVVLADRDIQATLKRTWRNLGFFDKLKVLGALGGASFSREEISEEELEKLKDRDTLTEMMNAFAEQLPQVKAPLIDERDVYLMASTERAPGDSVVSVVGAGHVPGMITRLGKDADLEALTVIPPPKWWVGWLKWVIPALVLGAFYYGYSKHGGENLSYMLLGWVIPNSVLAALFTALAGGKLLSIMAAFVASPITSLNPTIGAGMVVGLLEAWLRKPTVEDAEAIPEQATNLKGVYANRFTRVLLVAVAANLGSALGAYVGLGLLVPYFLK